MSKKNMPFTKKAKVFIRNMAESNTLIFIVSLFISFFVWVAVAMYASPEESVTISNVPINVNTENSLVAQNNYKNFWQSEEKIDVVVTGPRYMVASMTPEHVSVTVNLSNVDSAGISEVPLKVNLKSESQDMVISSYSKKSINVYFDVEMEKTFDIHVDSDSISEKIAETYQLNSANLTVPKITLKGPATEMKKIVDVVANPVMSDEKLYETQTLPVTISLEGENAVDTVSINKYIRMVDAQENNVKIKIDKLVTLVPVVEFIGADDEEPTYSINTQAVFAKIDTEIAKTDTEYDYNSETIVIKTIDCDELEPGKQTVTIKASDIVLPDGLSITDKTFTFNIEINYVLPVVAPPEVTPAE